jgi:hypothetical protein
VGFVAHNKSHTAGSGRTASRYHLSPATQQEHNNDNWETLSRVIQYTTAQKEVHARIAKRCVTVLFIPSRLLWSSPHFFAGQDC